MTNDKKKGLHKKGIPLLIYLFGLAAQVYSLFIYYNSDVYLVHKPFRITLYAFFVFYLLFGFYMIFRLFRNKSNSIAVLIIIFTVLLVCFPFTNKYQPKKYMEMYDYNKINYLLRYNTSEFRRHRDSEQFFQCYLENKNVYVSTTENHLFASNNKYNKNIAYKTSDFNLIVDANLELSLSNYEATNIASDDDYYCFTYEYQYEYDESANSIMVFAYVGEDLHDAEDIMVCSDSKGVLYFMPRYKWEEINE